MDVSLKKEFGLLFEQNKNLSPQDVLDMRQETFKMYLRHLGMGPTRTEHIMAACRTMVEDFDGKVPDTVKGLLTLKGVGPKIAHVMMKEVFGISTGIAIDCHLHRIFFRLGWCSTGDKDKIETTRRELESLFPRVQFGDLNRIYAGLGQLLQENPQRLLEVARKHVPLVVATLLELIELYDAL